LKLSLQIEAELKTTLLRFSSHAILKQSIN